jgi:ABC-type nitrate/sulfonate/bicarbonate transport system permease component
MDDVVAWTVLLVVLNLLIQAAVTVLERRMLRWRDEASLR